MNALQKLELNLVHSFWLLPPDLHERQRYIASRIEPQQKILDVGGEQRLIGTLSNASDYYTINVESETNQTPQYLKDSQKDLFYDGKHLPFKDGEFDVLVCTDVLEHVPPTERTALIKEMLRVAKKQLIISAPFGTPEHLQGEKDMYHDLKDTHEVDFLREHVERGLPKPEEVEAWAAQFGGSLTYSGDFRRARRLYEFQSMQVGWGPANHVLLFLKLAVYFALNVVMYPLVVGSKQYNPFTNRFYLEINKA